jgi:molybdopterin-guanine dinucleotide biosynthesis protein A
MGGRAKGLLVAPSGETIVARWTGLFARVGLPCVLVGSRPEYADLGLPIVEDDPPGVGPLGGLAGLLAGGPAVAVACDMPHVSEALLRRLVAGSPAAPILAPRRGRRWEPLFARYDASVLPLVRARLAGGRLGLQGLLDEAGAAELPVGETEWAELEDWDTLPP